MNGLKEGLATVKVLVYRDLVRFFRQPTRIVGALVQPLLFWVVMGQGFAAYFHAPGAEGGYVQYFYPGVLVMVAVFASIFSSSGLIEDKQQGFLQAVMVGPAPRWALVVGKSLGASSVALLQVVVFLLLVVVAGWDVKNIAWTGVVTVTLLMVLGLSFFSFALAWVLNNNQAYHAVQMTVLMPLWMLSGAMFPVQAQSVWLTWVMRLNPLTYSVEGLREALSGSYEHAVLHMGVLCLLMCAGVWGAMKAGYASE
jgi:ABC-2 type transport system permease protein